MYVSFFYHEVNLFKKHGELILVQLRLLNQLLEPFIVWVLIILELVAVLDVLLNTPEERVLAIGNERLLLVLKI